MDGEGAQAFGGSPSDGPSVGARVALLGCVDPPIALGNFRIDGGGKSPGIALKLESKMHSRATDVPRNHHRVFASWLQFLNKTLEPGVRFIQIRIVRWLVSLRDSTRRRPASVRQRSGWLERATILAAVRN
jgi:hypothetical protein